MILGMTLLAADSRGFTDSEQKWYHGFPLTRVLLSKLLFVRALLFGGPRHHLNCRHGPEQPCYVDIVSNPVLRSRNGCHAPAQEPVIHATVAQATLSKK